MHFPSASRLRTQNSELREAKMLRSIHLSLGARSSTDPQQLSIIKPSVKPSPRSVVYCSGLNRRSAMMFLAIFPTVRALSAEEQDGFCQKWRKEVETDSSKEWKVVPTECSGYVGQYIQGGQYTQEVEKVIEEAIKYAESTPVKGDGKDIWVFDIDETALSNVPLFANNKFGVEMPSLLDMLSWNKSSKSTPLPTLNLYNRLKELGFKVVFITARLDVLKPSTIVNLQNAGYKDWDNMILRKPTELFLTCAEYKSMKRKELEEQGYRIIGNVGDQWSDITGYSMGSYTFKLPNPLYYTK